MAIFQLIIAILALVGITMTLLPLLPAGAPFPFHCIPHVVEAEAWPIS